MGNYKGGEMRYFTYCLIASILLFASKANAAGTCTQAWEDVSAGVRRLQFTCTADAANGSYPSTVTDDQINGYILSIVVNPGSPAPQALYDATLTDGDGLEVTGSMIGDLSATVTSRVIPKNDTVNNTFGSRFTAGKLTLAITNNNVNSAVTVISVYVAR